MKVYKILGVLKHYPLTYIGVVVLLFGNIICYKYNGRVLRPHTNLIMIGLVAINIFNKVK